MPNALIEVTIMIVAKVYVPWVNSNDPSQLIIAPPPNCMQLYRAPAQPAIAPNGAKAPAKELGQITVDPNKNINIATKMEITV